VGEGVSAAALRAAIPRAQSTRNVHSCADTSGHPIPVSSALVPASPKQLVHRQVALGELALSPDGTLLAYTRRTVRGNDYETHLWLVPVAGGRPRQLTRGAV
jgi:hypothetical protein